MQKIKDWFLDIICGLVSKPEEVKINATQDEQGIIFVVTVAKEDTGKVIGKKGSIAEALRIILRSSGYIDGIRVSMKIDVPGSKFNLE